MAQITFSYQETTIIRTVATNCPELWAERFISLFHRMYAYLVPFEEITVKIKN